jgi:nucleoside-diphosphate-sugar epimerase
VIHTAAIAGIWGEWKLFFETNTLGTQHVIESCRAHGVSRLVYTSSPSVTFDGREQCGIDETAAYPKSWLAHYPHTKALAEQMVLSANGDGLRTCALRPHLIWGPGDRQLVPRLWQRARRGQLRRVGDGTNLVDMVYVDNAAAAHLLALDALNDQRATGKAYFISQGEPVNCWKWIDELLAVQNLGPVRKSISLAAARRLGAMFEKGYQWLHLPGEPPMTRFLAAQLGLSHYFSLQRARGDLRYEPTISTAEGMRRLATWAASVNSTNDGMR